MYFCTLCAKFARRQPILTKGVLLNFCNGDTALKTHEAAGMLTSVTTETQPDPVNQRELIDSLRGKIEGAQTARRNDDGAFVSTGSRDIDQLLPFGGIPRGTLTEWFVDNQGNSGEFLALLAASRACDDGGALVIADPQRQFHPPAAALLGINLANLVILRPGSSGSFSRNRTAAFQTNDLFWAIEQALRSTAVGAVWGCLTEINERWFRRFQLSAESSGCLGLFVRPTQTRQHPSWAEIRWQVRARSSPENRQCRQVSLQRLRCRAGGASKTIQLNIDTITGTVQHAPSEHANQRRIQTHPLSLASQLAHPTASRRTARA